MQSRPGCNGRVFFKTLKSKTNEQQTIILPGTEVTKGKGKTGEGVGCKEGTSNKEARIKIQAGYQN